MSRILRQNVYESFWMSPAFQYLFFLQWDFRNLSVTYSSKSEKMLTINIWNIFISPLPFISFKTAEDWKKPISYQNDYCVKRNAEWKENVIRVKGDEGSLFFIIWTIVWILILFFIFMPFNASDIKVNNGWKC